MANSVHPRDPHDGTAPAGGGLRRSERLGAIADVVMTEGSVRIDDLVDRFAVSTMTIHRDVDALVGRGLVRKSRGSVTATATSLFEASTTYRSRQQVRAKAALARAVLTRIEPGTSVIVDDSTTFLPLADLLPERAPLIVVTNFVPMVTALTGAQDVEVVCTGGTLHPWCDSFLGDMARPLAAGDPRRRGADVHLGDHRRRLLPPSARRPSPSSGP